MAEKQIGIKLDVKSTGLKQVDDTLDSVSKNLADLNDKVMEGQQRGWGSEKQTKELREQLRAMQQLLQMTERMARAKGVRSDSFGQQSREISSMQRELSGLRTYRNPISGKIHDKFGANAANGFEKAISTGSKVTSGLVAFDLLNSLRSGISTGTQLSYGYGDLGKRMAPGTNSQKYGMNLSQSMQGYGYADTDLLQSATSYGAATGRMDSGKFSSQLQAINQTGRNYGLDLSSVTENFASMYKGGVTGGTSEQMSPQEYANLVANAVNRGNMQGKEMQVIGQIQQLVQMGVSSSGESGDIKTLSAFLAMGNKSGNQAFSGNLPLYLSAINGGMTSPGGGYAGQALMMQAIGGKDMGYYETQVQAAKGAFGVNEKNGKTNIENVMSHLSKTFGENDIDQKSVMFSTLFPGMNAAQSKEFIKNYTNEDGSFKQGGMDVLKKQMQQETPAIPQNETDEARNRTRFKENAANNAGSNTLEGRSYLDSLQGEVLDKFGEPLVYGAGAALAASTAYTSWRMGKGAFDIGKKFMNRGVPTVSGGIPPVPSGGPLALPSGSGPVPVPNSGPPLRTAIPNTPGRVVPLPNRTPIDVTPKTSTAGKVLGPLGTLLGLSAGVDIGDSLGDYVFGHTKGTNKPNGVFSNPFTHEKWEDNRAPIWSRSSSTVPEQAAANTEQVTPQANTSPTQGVTGAALAPLVASTIVALGPYMAQLKPIIGGTDGNPNKPITDLVYRGQDGGSRDLMYRNSDASSGGLRLASYNANEGSQSNNSRTFKSVKTGGSVSGGSQPLSGSVGDFVKEMLPYAQQAAAQTGLPEEFILGQWGHETGWGKSSVSQQNNNFAGIKPWSNSKGGAAAGTNSMYAGYDSKSDFADGYASFLNSNGRYSGLLDAAKNGASNDDLVRIMGRTGYAEDPEYTKKLKGTIDSAKQAIKVTGEVTVNVKQPDGSTSVERVPITAEFTGIGA